MYGTGIHAGKKTGPTRRADWTLAIGASEGRARFHQAVYMGRRYMIIAQRADGIVALLVGAYPEYIRLQ